MTTETAKLQGNWFTLSAASLGAVVIGFASTILVCMEGARAVGATPTQQASAAAVLCYAMAIATATLCVFYRKPVVIAWSTPGSALLATSAVGIAWPEAIGAFVFAGALTVLTAFIKPLADAIRKMPAGIAAALLAGVLFRFVLGVPGAAIELPAMVVPLIILFFVLRLFLPLYTVPVLVCAGLLLAIFGGSIAGPVHIGITPLTFDMPQWNWQVLLSIGIPLYLVTMAAQNLPGFAVLKAQGYEPPVAGALFTTGVMSMLTAPFGTHAVNMSAITLAIIAGPDSHQDPTQRWKAFVPYLIQYLIVGLAAGTFVSTLGAMPKPLITAIAGLALFGALMNGMTAMVKDAKDTEAALVTFLVTASGVTLLGVGAAFWGLLAGLLLWFAKRALQK
jgi:benzoate membrane transport protein